jgi:long-subunit acyl-CoA synthetase (AMP-forming)
MVTKNHPGAHRQGSVGKVLRGKRVIIEEDGAIVVCSDYPVNGAYLYAPPGTSEKIFIRPGHVRTGDLGYLDEEGYLFIRGRADNVIVLDNGKKIDVQPIESRLRNFASITECVVFCPTQTELVAVISPASLPVNEQVIRLALQQANAAAEKDERIARIVIAAEPFSIENGQLTSQFKPIRRVIFEQYQSQILNPQQEHSHAI